jgi:glycosyltransferase involved in cell wall biosynthesis
VVRLGLVTGEFPPLQGGVGDYTHELAVALAAQGCQVSVITRAACRAPEPKPVYALYPVIQRWSFPALWAIRRLARSLRLDWLNIQYQAAAYDLSAPIHFLPRLAGVPCVVTFHDLRIPYLFPKAGSLRPAAVTALARWSRGAIATDPADEAELRRRGIPRVAQIPIGSNIARSLPPGYERQQWRAEKGISPDDFCLGYFGFLNASKGGDALIGALAALVGADPRFKLLLIGGAAGSSDPTDAAFGARLDELVARHGLASRICRTSFVAPAEVSGWLAACDVMVLPYRDGVSLRRGSLMAALAHGCPIISTRPAHAVSEIRDGENMLLVDGSPESIAGAVLRLRDDPGLRARLGQGASELSVLFRWDTIAARTVNFVRSL